MSFNITLEGGTSLRLPTAGKYCDRDIIITAEGGKEDLDEVLAEQDGLISQIEQALIGKAGGGGITPSGTLEIAENGEYDVTNYAGAKVDVPIPDGYIKPGGTKSITANGTHDVTGYASAEVNVPTPAPVVQPLEITENGTYNAPDGVDGYSPVVVNVAGSGGGVSAHTTGVYIPASTTGTIKIEHGLGKIPHFFSIVPREIGVVAADSSSVFLAGVFTKVHDSAIALHTTFRPSSGNLLAFGSQSTSATPSWGLTAVDENYATIKCYSGMPFQLTFSYEWHAIRYD